MQVPMRVYFNSLLEVSFRKTLNQNGYVNTPGKSKSSLEKPSPLEIHVYISSAWAVLH